MICSVDGCERPAKARKMCTTHYSTWVRKADPSVLLRRGPVRRSVEEWFTRTDGCWEWTGHRASNGYGKWQGIGAHRAVYQELVGPIPEGLDLDHLCRNRGCVDPDHLEPVTRSENLLRSPLVGRWNRQCSNSPIGLDLTAALVAAAVAEALGA